MKKILTVTLLFLTAFSLVAVAHADVIFSPVEIAGYCFWQALPWILVGAVVGVTVYLLKKFWRKKK